MMNGAHSVDNNNNRKQIQSSDHRQVMCCGPLMDTFAVFLFVCLFVLFILKHKQSKLIFQIFAFLKGDFLKYYEMMTTYIT